MHKNQQTDSNPKSSKVAIKSAALKPAKPINYPFYEFLYEPEEDLLEGHRHNETMRDELYSIFGTRALQTIEGAYQVQLFDLFGKMHLHHLKNHDVVDDLVEESEVFFYACLEVFSKMNHYVYCLVEKEGVYEGPSIKEIIFDFFNKIKFSELKSWILSAHYELILTLNQYRLNTNELTREINHCVDINDYLFLLDQMYECYTDMKVREAQAQVIELQVNQREKAA